MRFRIERRRLQMWLALLVALAASAILPQGTARARTALSVAPTIGIVQHEWTHVNSCQPSTSQYWSHRSNMRVGRQWDTTCKWRSLMRFDLAPLVGATIIDAYVKVTADHTGACAGADIVLWRSEENQYFPGVTWNNAAWYNAIEGEHFSANQGSSCPKPDDEGLFDEGGGRYLEGELARYLGNGWTQMALGLRAQDESDHFDWSYYHPGSAVLVVTYNHAPTPPAGQRITAGCGYSCDATGAQVRTGTPTLEAMPGDPNGGTLDRLEFEVYDRATRSELKAASGMAVSRPAVGEPRGWQVTPALPQGDYSWRARGCDSVVCGPYSPWFDFTVDLTPPSALTVSSAAYPAKPSGKWSGGIGVPGAFTLSASGASRFEVVLNGVGKGWFDSTGTSPTGYQIWTGDLTPDRDGVNALRVKAADQAGNVTASAVAYDFLVAPAATRSWEWGLNEGAGTSAASSPAGRPLAVTGAAAWTAGRAGGGALSLNGATRWAGQPVVDTTRPFTVTAWVNRGASAAAPMTAVSQDGAAGSGFRLQYRTDLDLDPDNPGTDPAWCFTMFAGDGGAETAACSDEATAAGWVHLAGVYDQANRLIRIYVNGHNFDGSDRKTYEGSWSAAGDWVLGAAKGGTGRTQFWSGAIDRVAAHTSALNQSGIADDLSRP
ncbi:LamG-like jellyroll fold domain-containing protein [Nonomuraea sp. NPDC050153]|uniref:LamG-like jellyroll fold domain-containing protein n=1 Tax=Nonomuraea sp. NPDC050153 TaxID=3364359 RepID=UPI0037996C08